MVYICVETVENEHLLHNTLIVKKLEITFYSHL